MNTSGLDAEQIFNAARKIEAPCERAAYLDGACGDDADLRARVDALLAAEAKAGDFLRNAESDPNATLPRSGPAPDAHLPAEQVGQSIGRYKLLEQIGEGGFGTVWLAEQREPVKRRVALKIIKLGMDTKQVVARFEAERQALAMMDHPNIAKVFDGGATDTGRPYFVMEYIRGVPILEYCDTEKLDTKARLELFISVCHALQHAHHKGIIHRDIKPSNVLITLHDGKPVPKVIDFGIAKATNTELTQKTLFTQHRQMIGTPAYMSPEQAEMSGLDIDTRSDVYSLGVLLYELLTGTTPFDDKELLERGYAEMMRIIREVEPHKPSTRLSSLGETATRTAQQRHAADPQKLGTILRGDLDWIVMKCLEKDRTRRYETANGLASDIKRHLSDEPVVAGRPSAGYKLRKFVKRNRGQVISGGVVATVLIAATAVSIGFALSEAEQRHIAAAEATRADKEKAVAQAVNDFLTEDLLAAVAPAPETGQGKDVLMRDVLDEAAERIEEASRVGGRFEETPMVEASIRATLGRTYLLLGEYAAAEPHLERVRLLRRRELGEEHPKTLASMNNLANLYGNQGRYEEAEPLQVTTLEIQKRVLGEEHPHTLTSMMNLANLYRNQGRYEEAEPLQVTTLEIKKRVLGEEHPDTLSTSNNLASLYRNQGRYDEAEPLYVKTLEIQKRVLGDEHRSTLGSITNLGNLYLSLKRFDDARAMYESSLPIKRRVLGMQHPWTRIALEGLAQAYDGSNRGDDALALWRELQDFQLAQVEDADASAQMLNNAAWDLLTHEFEELWDPARALLLAERACRMEKEAGGAELWGYLDTLAMAQHLTGDTAAAVNTQRRAIELMPEDADPEMAERLAMYEAALAAEGETLKAGHDQ
jgi:tetratricopeptide (TPR) repeat protein/tRNA A-37 threonylcarbamoyl transferase component Bud32